jgi:hypothetical protein
MLFVSYEIVVGIRILIDSEIVKLVLRMLMKGSGKHIVNENNNDVVLHL